MPRQNAPWGATEKTAFQCGSAASTMRFDARIANAVGRSTNAVRPAAAAPAASPRRATAPASGRSRSTRRRPIQSAQKRTPSASVSGCPARAAAANTRISAAAVRARPRASRPRSSRKSIHGQRQKTAVCGKKIHCARVIESAKPMAPNTAARDETESSRSQSHIPASASSSLTHAAARKADGSPRGSGRQGERRKRRRLAVGRERRTGAVPAVRARAARLRRMRGERLGPREASASRRRSSTGCAAARSRT